ncbi:MAG: protoporphyrinogen oxidase [Chlamydiales bacterium]
MKKIVIIGGGIAGLSAGWYHKKKGDHVTILEKSHRPGGWIQSIQEDGFLLEQGPRGFRPTGTGKRTLALIKELGLEKTLIAADKKARKRYLVINGKLSVVSPYFLLRQGIIPALLRDACKPVNPLDDETIADFCYRRFTKKITQRVVDPLVKGIFGGDIHTLSMRNCFPALWHREKNGSIIRNLLKSRNQSSPSLYSFRDGMETLPKALAERLQENLLFNVSLIRIEKGGVILADQTLEADTIIAAVPAYALTDKHPFIYQSMTIVNMGWKRDLLSKKGYGCLVPSLEKEAILGMTWDSEIFPQQNQGEQTRICVMIQGEAEAEVAIKGVQKYLGIDSLPDKLRVTKAKDAIPQYLIGHHKHLAYFQKCFHVELIGHNYTGIGINNCIEAGWKSAQ